MKPVIFSIIIPAYNEEKRIKETLEDYIPYAKKHGCELIVVCDGTDGTAEIVMRFMGAKRFAKAKRKSINPPLSLLQFQERLGKGRAVIEGFKAAKGEIAGYTDADDATQASEFGKLLDAVKSKKADCAIGSRRIKGSAVMGEGFGPKRAGSIAINIIAKVLFGLNISDTQCGAKVFRKKDLDKAIPLLKSKGFEFDIELLWLLSRQGVSIKEIPIVWRAKKDSKFSMKSAPSMLINLILRRMGF